MQATTMFGGRYKVGKRLGGGSFGEVFLGTSHSNPEPIVTDAKTGEHMAAKVVICALTGGSRNPASESAVSSR